MPRTYHYKLHSERVLWPEYFPLEDVLLLKRNTDDDYVWAAGYQCNPIPSSGSVFLRSWWSDANTRYDITDRSWINKCIQRFIFWDTAVKDGQNSDYSAYTVAELMPDYRVVIRAVWRDKVISADLPDVIAAVAMQYNYDEKLKAVLIEDKQSGTNAIQWLHNNTEPWLRKLIEPYTPIGSKVERAKRITRFCKHGRLLLPLASSECTWLAPFTDELFSFPGAANDDMADTFVMVGDHLQYYLADGMVSAGIAPDEN